MRPGPGPGPGPTTCPRMRLDHVEPRLLELGGQRVDRPPVRGDDRMVERLHLVADEEPHKKPATGAEHPRELAERTTEARRLVVDERVPRQHSP